LGAVITEFKKLIVCAKAPRGFSIAKFTGVNLWIWLPPVHLFPRRRKALMTVARDKGWKA
jgi:hypothetical protein